MKKKIIAGINKPNKYIYFSKDLKEECMCGNVWLDEDVCSCSEHINHSKCMEKHNCTFVNCPHNWEIK